jgi:hypothetical protein
MKQEFDSFFKATAASSSPNAAMTPTSSTVAGFLARWNVTMATPIEPEPNEIGEKYLAPLAWQAGQHKRSFA